MCLQGHFPTGCTQRLERYNVLVKILGEYLLILQVTPQFDIIQSNGLLLLRDPGVLNLRIVPALSQGGRTKPAWSLAWPSHWCSRSASLLPNQPLPTSFQLKALITIYKEVFVLQKCSQIYDSSNMGGGILHLKIWLESIFLTSE